ncbi:TRAP transporter large permease subunit [Sulfuritalea sp.]|uniref:TRAP transporter large permease n=1 Tax=Sulfuritalea sp. TaxID=2480090 RepID=UPI00286EA377|nr:TRAP transporter large permease subunit [Sulfuritalea sp.]
MIEILQHNLAPIMFGGLIIFLLMGYSVAFSLAACGLFFGWLGVELGLLPHSLLQALPLRIFGIMQNDTLLAIPFFTFMGLILERSGMAEDLLDTIGQLFGPIRGGLAYAVIFVGAMLAATTGVVAASVISMGLISLPIMLRYGYDRRIASGVIAASGTLAQIIPPSLVLIVIADQLGRSVGDLYAGAFIPGFVLTGLYVGFVFLVSMVKPAYVPALPLEARTIREDNGTAGLPSVLALVVVSTAAAIAYAKTRPAETPTDELIVVSMCVGVGIAFALAVLNRVTKMGLLSRMAERVTFVLIPPLALIFLVLGTIFLGIATPTEGGAMGATGALIMAMSRRRLNLNLMKQAMDATMKLSCFVVFILLGATVFSLTFQAVDGSIWVEHLLTGLPGGQIGFLIVVNLLVFFLAFFLDFFELAFIVIPLLGPVAEKLGIDLVWFGVLMAVNMQTSFMHPPFGFALFYLRSVAPHNEYIDRLTKKTIPPVTTTQIYWGAVPFVIIQVIMVGIIIAFPQLVTGSAEAPNAAAETIQLEAPPATEQDAPADGNDKATEGKEETEEAKAEREKEEEEDPAKALQQSIDKGK